MASEDTPVNLSSESKLKNDTTSELIVVGVGASAGGLEALQEFLSNMPTDNGMAIVVAQHLSPSYRSMMAELLEKDSTIPVVTAVDNTKIEANKVYVCPPNYNIEISSDDRIRLMSYPEVRHTPRPSVDMLFESIAQHKGEHAIGVVLSGTGTDGSRGIRAIKGENGFGVVQDPNDAKYDGMPNSAINSGNVDLILQATEIGHELKNIIYFPRNYGIDNDGTMPRETYHGIIQLLKLHCKVDFSLYKENTILRRIERRMTSLKIRKSAIYLEHLKNHNEEVVYLFNDMLIGVTSFFRDTRAFDNLQRELTHYIRHKNNIELRIWCTACSTGEEAYTIAIILSEILGDRIEQYKIQIFATDIDSKAISFARNAIYPESALANIPRTIKHKYFMVNGEQFEIIKSIKSHVIFSVHDINNDPPFLRLDLITCRNLMIYFTVELQRQLLPMFHYALNPKGLLMLGQSESIGVFQEQYRSLSKTGKIYEALYVGKQLPPERKNHKSTNGLHKAVDMPILIPDQPKRNKLDTELVEIITETLREYVLPNAILLNENQDIIFTQGSNSLLIRPTGLPSNNIFKNLHPQLSIDLRSAFHHIQSGKKIADTGFQSFQLNGKDVWVKLIILAIERDGPLGDLTLIFSQIEQPENIPLLNNLNNKDNSQAIALEQQRLLVKTKEQLQNVIEELETSNEEMQSMNEELQSSNEELQSSNEELETTNEELQSTNEELQTAYAELRMAYEEREHQRNELERLKVELQQSTRLLNDAEVAGKMGSWLWDISTRKLVWSNGCYHIFDLDKDVFHPSYEAFIGLASGEYRSKLEEQLTNLLHNNAKQPFIFEAQDVNKNIVIISLEAVVSFNDLKQATRVMGTMKDITEQVLKEREQAGYKEKITYILNSSLNAAFVLDLQELRIGYANAEFRNLLQHDQKSINSIRSDDFYSLYANEDKKTIVSIIDQVSTALPGQTFPATYKMNTSNSDQFIEVYANHTVYEIDEITGMPSKMLVTLFAAK
ncbi:chemotaxis protein CheB [Vibrio sp. TH_r3]|uniref:chemotaxis protein CheB n=1 Tax=Vibrio sp. TH_r3 TaxID=3082084 RepID=UPI002954F7D4|nr:chemotaxis protein CheB [Vibrio sp. TH_r3]MDV7104837.1 chemotaxis protein CheB [Vibrio sp. TH_r3]